MKNTVKTFLFAAALLLSARLFASDGENARPQNWLPFRIALYDCYADETEWDENVSSVYGLRLGLFASVNKEVGGVSLSLFLDGASDANGFEGENYIDGNFFGIKIGGIAAISGSSVYGLQLAGLLNSTAAETRGFQIAAGCNESEFMKGFQIAGLCCSAAAKLKGVQIAGIVAECGTAPEASESSGIQISALSSRCEGAFSGVQISAFNWCEELSGVQIGLVNYANTLRGLQIGLFNNSSDSFAPLVHFGF